MEELVGGGGLHYDGAGGFSGAGAEQSSDKAIGGVNGLGGGTSSIVTGASSGGGYYGNGFGKAASEKGTSKIGGQNGTPHTAVGWLKDVAGNGGTSGAGGTVYYTNMENIFAYNGDMITTEKEEDYEKEYYEYNKDGTQNMENRLKVIIKPNGKKIIPAKIFAQSGTIRETYTTNQGQFTLDKVTRQLKPGETLPSIADTYAKVVLFKATDEIPTKTTSYNNGYMLNQGIGSRCGLFGIRKWNF